MSAQPPTGGLTTYRNHTGPGPTTRHIKLLLGRRAVFVLVVVAPALIIGVLVRVPLVGVAAVRVVGRAGRGPGGAAVLTPTPVPVVGPVVMAWPSDRPVKDDAEGLPDRLPRGLADGAGDGGAD